jgi:mRNA interferase RelE/StbE
MRAEFAPHVAAIVRRLVPDLKQSVKQAVRALRADPEVGEPLQRELEGLWRYRVRRFRIVYRVDRRRRVIEILAVGHRSTVYDAVAAELVEMRRKPTRPRSTRRG